MQFKFSRLTTLFLIIAICSSRLDATQVPTKVAGVLERCCFSCHDKDSAKGDVRLDNLAAISLKDQSALLNKMHEQLYLGEMPPKKKRAQPTDPERQSLIDWVSGELKKHGGSKLTDKLRYPDYGNYVDHEKLFSGEIKTAPFTPARRWLVSPQDIYVV